MSLHQGKIGDQWKLIVCNSKILSNGKLKFVLSTSIIQRYGKMK
jgi:hypothetical protein